jgi:hypothetical protein
MSEEQQNKSRTIEQIAAKYCDERYPIITSDRDEKWLELYEAVLYGADIALKKASDAWDDGYEKGKAAAKGEYEA